MKTSYKIPIIVIQTILVLSFFVISYDTGLGDTPDDIEVQFDAEEYSVNYFVVNGNTDNIEIDIPLDMIDGVFMIYVNDQVVDDERVILDGNKIIVNHDQNIESVKLMGSHDLGGLENENTLRPDDRLEVRNSAGYTTVYITLSSWDEYYEWEKDRGTEHDAMPPILFDDSNINPIVEGSFKYFTFIIRKKAAKITNKAIKSRTSIVSIGLL